MVVRVKRPFDRVSVVVSWANLMTFLRA